MIPETHNDIRKILTSYSTRSTTSVTTRLLIQEISSILDSADVRMSGIEREVIDLRARVEVYSKLNTFGSKLDPNSNQNSASQTLETIRRCVTDFYDNLTPQELSSLEFEVKSSPATEWKISPWCDSRLLAHCGRMTGAFLTLGDRRTMRSEFVCLVKQHIES